MPAAARGAPARGGSMSSADHHRRTRCSSCSTTAERLVRLHPPRPDHVRGARAPDRRGRPARRDLEPVDLGEGDRRLDRLRGRDRGAAARGRRATRRRSTSSSRSRTSRDAADAFRPVYERDRAARRVRVDRGLARRSPTTPRARSRRRSGCGSAIDARQRDDQGAGDAGGHPRDPRADRRAAST